MISIVQKYYIIIQTNDNDHYNINTVSIIIQKVSSEIYACAPLSL